MTLQPQEEHPHGLSDRDFDTLFTTDKPIIFAYHGYPWLIHRLTYRRTNHGNLHVRGYKEEGTTTTPFDMAVLNDLDRFHLVADVIDRVPHAGVSGRTPQAGHARQAHRAPRVHRAPWSGHAGGSRVALAHRRPSDRHRVASTRPRAILGHVDPLHDRGPASRRHGPARAHRVMPASLRAAGVVRTCAPRRATTRSRPPARPGPSRAATGRWC